MKLPRRGFIMLAVLGMLGLLVKGKARRYYVMTSYKYVPFQKPIKLREKIVGF